MASMVAFSSNSDQDATSNKSVRKDSLQWPGVQRRSLWTKIKYINPLYKGVPPPIPEDPGVIPQSLSHFWSYLWFGWMSPLMRVGYQRPLEQGDLWRVDRDREADVMADRLAINLERMRKRKSTKFALFWACNATFFKLFWTAGLLKICADVNLMTQPLLVKKLIQFASDAYYGEPVSVGAGVGYAIGLAVMNQLASFCNHHVFYGMMMTGAMTRASLITLMYRKSLVLSNRSRVTFSNAKITNMISTDSYRIDFAAGYFHMIWTAPIQIIICLVILLINLGVPSLAGFALLIVATPALGKIAKVISRWRKDSIVFTDSRVRHTQEILSSMRIIKYYAWEEPFLSRVVDLRNAELKIVRKLLTVRSAVFAVSLVIPVFASMLAFIVVKLTGHALIPAQVFSSLTLFNLLRMPLMLLPLAFTAATDAWVAFGRIQELLFAEEMAEPVQVKHGAPNAVELVNASFTWESEGLPEKKTPKILGKVGWRRFVPFTHRPQEEVAEPVVEKTSNAEDEVEEEKREEQENIDTINNAETANMYQGATMLAEKPEELRREMSQLSKVQSTDRNSIHRAYSKFSVQSTKQAVRRDASKINNVNLTVKRGELIGICGAIGSGKSSLLAAIVGDMRRSAGEVVIGGTVGFCPQSAWIQSATVRSNILFGQEYIEAKYQTVLRACALEADLETLPFGDLTEIGERGVTLSGGQKARIAIARATYFDPDIFCLDDVLSALDAHVGRHLFEACISGLMAGKTRILATHQLHFLSNVDRIVFMNDDGRVDVGSLDELKISNPNFSQQVLAGGTSQDEKKEDEDEVESEAIGDNKPKLEKKDVEGIMQAEERAVQSVDLAVYAEYCRQGGGLWVVPAMLAVIILTQASNIATNLWLSYWSSNLFDISTADYIGIYASIGGLQAISYFVMGFGLTWIGNRSSKLMMAKALARTMRAPMSFFDTTPLGRIINRFSKDVDTMDNNLTDSFRMFFSTFASIFGTFILIIVIYHFFVIALVPLAIGFIIAAAYYRASAREMKRMDSIARSSVFAHVGETLSGIAVIRAYNLQMTFRHFNEQTINRMNQAYFLTLTNQRWLGLRLDVVGSLLIFVVGILVTTNRFDTNPSTTGLVLSYCLSIVGMMSWMVRQMAEVENNMNSTERMYHYGFNLENEAPATIEGHVPAKSWPEKGAIEMKNVGLRYRPELPMVLHHFNLSVKGGERIGVVGRTGAGKSSIMAALYRIAELAEGKVEIDGVDVSTIGLYDLRSKLSIIPQDPILFGGTIRSNLDPFGDRSDRELWDALRRSWLVRESEVPDPADPTKAKPRFDLDTKVDDEGLNFSLGERQCLSLSRALVRRSRILVLDEATSSVDFETDAKIQRTISTEFTECTLLCIAHRLRTIINYDRVCVLDAGKVVEFDTPHNLFRTEGSIFKSMCERSKISDGDF